MTLPEQLEIINPSKLPEGQRQQLLEKVVVFFRDEALRLLERFSPGDDIQEDGKIQFEESHSFDELMKKVPERNRFFRIVRDSNLNVIGYFESLRREKIDELPYETMQWVFIKRDFQRQGLSKNLWREYFEYIKTYLQKSGLDQITIISFCKVQNGESVNMHKYYGFEVVEVDVGNVRWKRVFHKDATIENI